MSFTGTTDVQKFEKDCIELKEAKEYKGRPKVRIGVSKNNPWTKLSESKVFIDQGFWLSPSDDDDISHCIVKLICQDVPKSLVKHNNSFDGVEFRLLFPFMHICNANISCNPTAHFYKSNDMYNIDFTISIMQY